MGDELSPMRLPTGGGMQDLYQAMNMMSDSVKNLGQTIAIGRATDKVNEIKNGELSDQDKKAQLNQVSQGLTASLTGLGTPANHIEQLVNSFQPKNQYANIQSPFEAMIAGKSDPKEINAIAEKYLKTQQEGKEDLAYAKADAAAARAETSRVQGGGMTDKTITQLSNLRKQIDPSTASSRSLYGRLGATSAKLQEVSQGLLAGDPEKLSNFNLAETAQSISSIYGGGTATVSGTHALMPAGINQDLAKLSGYVGSTIDPANAPGVGKAFKEITDRLQPIVDSQIRSNQKKTLRAELGTAAKGGDAFSAIAEGLIQNPDGTPETATVDKKTGRVVFASDAKIDRLDQYANKLLTNPKDPQAQLAFEAIKADPYYTQALMERPQLQQKLKKAYEMINGRDAFKGEPMPMKEEKK